MNNQSRFNFKNIGLISIALIGSVLFQISRASLPVCAQGLNASPHQATGKVNLPLLKGSTDQERLNRFSNLALKLVGMKRAQIEKVFGNGYYCQNEKQIQYALSTAKSSADGKRFSYIALSIEMKGERAAGFVVQSIDSN